ncbi:MAG: tetratricopeptide repeat protein, partial [Planctomycetota bacterium]
MARRRPILLAVVLASLATTAATGAGAGAGQETPLVAPAPLRAGDPAALRELWWSILESEPGSLESYWILQHWQQFLALEAKRPAERERWSRLRARLDDNGWTHRLAGWLLHEELLREGDLGAAEELGMTVGSPRRWIGVGPFGRHRATGLHRLFSPEKGVAGGASHEGTHGAVTWRPLEAPPRDTRLRPREQFSRQGAIYFLRARFGVEAAVEGILQAASGGSFRLFLDGKELFVVDRHRDALPQVARSGVRLGAGGHTILVKGDGAPISVLLRDVRGFPIPVADLDPWEEEVRDGGAESLPSLAPVGLPGAEWGAAWERGDLLPRLWLPLALLWASEGDAVACEEVLRAAEEQGLDPVALALTATRCADVLFYLPSAWKRNWLESLWERALASDPELVPVLLAVAEERYREDRIEEALPMIERVLEIQPRSLAAHLLREEIAGDRRWRRERLEALARLLELAPRHPRVLSLAIRRWSGEGRPDKALPLREALFGLRPRLAAGRELAIAYRSMGRVEEALGVVERLREVTGASIDFLNMERSLLERWGMHDRALQVIEELGRRIPQSAAL